LDAAIIITPGATPLAAVLGRLADAVAGLA